MIEFIAATYNEENEILDLLHHVYPYVDSINIVDDVSTDSTVAILRELAENKKKIFYSIMPEHSGLPETVKRQALKMCKPDSWIIMLDADERFAPDVLPKIISFINSSESKKYTHINFDLIEFMDDLPQRLFIKCRVFRNGFVTFSDKIHEDEVFKGKGISLNWRVVHRKTTSKQVQRELEYVRTYAKLLDAGQLEPDRYAELLENHYYIKQPHG